MSGSRGKLTHRSRAPWVTLPLALLLVACSPAGGTSPTPRASQADLTAAASGVCEALAALPDAAAADRAFTNVAHDALHALAAAPGLDRTLAAPVLEAMERVETDFDAPSDVAALAADLGDLHDAAGNALEALGTDVAPCGA